MSAASPLAFFGFSACVLLGALLVIWHIGRKLAARDPSDVRVVWYLFSLTATLTLMIAWWATGAGAIDATGSFRGMAGDWLMTLLKSTLDIKTAIKLYAGGVALVVVPQLLSWVLSGLFGCASAPMFIGPALRFLFWGVVKSFVVIAGVLFAATTYGWFRGWDSMTARQATVHMGAALLAITSAFSTLHSYRDFTEPWTPKSQPGPNAARVRRLIYRINAWMNRRIPQAEHARDSKLIDR